jgi:hypothetical protein
LKTFEVSLRARERRHQLRRDWDQHGKPLAHAADQLVDPPQVGLALAFRTVTQTLARLLLGTLVDRLQEQTGVIDHPLANAASGLLVMLEPLTQLSGRKPRLPLSPQQPIGMRSVGARQRCNHPRRRPTRQPALPNRSEGRLRQRCEQLQAPIDPAAITRATARSLALRHPKPLRELAQQQRLFDGGKGPALRARQDAKNSFRQVTRPPLNKGSVAAEPTQRRHPPIARSTSKRATSMARTLTSAPQASLSSPLFANTPHHNAIALKEK